MEVHCDKITIAILKTGVSNEHQVPADEVVIEDLVVYAGAKKGDNFACDIAAIKFNSVFNGKTVEKNYIAKYSRENHNQRLAFERESLIYTWMIPELQKLRESRCLKPLSFPGCFYASVEDQLIVMENMKSQNFAVVRKKPEPLSLAATKLVLEELASFHVTNQNYMETYPGGLSDLSKMYPIIFPVNVAASTQATKGMMIKLGSFLIQFCIMVVDKYGPEELSTKMKSFLKCISEKVTNIFDQEWKLDAITHGDAWYNNFLFRYSGNDDNPTEVTMFDLQNTKLGHIAIEVAHFIYSSTSPEQRKDYLQHLLRCYYDRFFIEHQALGENSASCFSFQTFLDEFNMTSTYGFVTGCIHSLGVLLDEDSPITFNLVDVFDDEARKRITVEATPEILARSETDLKFRSIIIGLAEEAMERNVL